MSRLRPVLLALLAFGRLHPAGAIQRNLVAEQPRDQLARDDSPSTGRMQRFRESIVAQAHELLHSKHKGKKRRASASSLEAAVARARSAWRPEDGLFWTLCGKRMHQNLGGLGPDSGAAELRFFDVATWENRSLDLVITNASVLASRNITMNGKLNGTEGCVARVNVLSSTNVTLIASFVHADDTNPSNSAGFQIDVNVHDLEIGKKSGTMEVFVTKDADSWRSSGTIEIESPPTPLPTNSPIAQPTSSPTRPPTPQPTSSPTSSPTQKPTPSPTGSPTPQPTSSPTNSPTPEPTLSPTNPPTPEPTISPTSSPTPEPTFSPTSRTLKPTSFPTGSPTSSQTQATTDVTTSSSTSDAAGPLEPSVPKPDASPSVPSSPMTTPSDMPPQLDPLKEVGCLCRTPGAGTVGFNSYVCEDDTEYACSATELCVANYSFGKDMRSEACQAMPENSLPQAGTAAPSGTPSTPETPEASPSVPSSPMTTPADVPPAVDPLTEVGCLCRTPGAGTMGFNSYVCEDDTEYACGATELCVANYSFGKDMRSEACQAMPTNSLPQAGTAAPSGKPSTPETPNTPAIPRTSETPATPESPVREAVPETPATPATSAPATDAKSPTTETPEEPVAPSTSATSTTPEAVAPQSTSEAPATPATPATTSPPVASETSSTPEAAQDTAATRQPPETVVTPAEPETQVLTSIVWCTCTMPKSRSVGFNQYTCDDGSTRFCAANEWCHATTPFEKHKAGTDTEGKGCGDKNVMCICNSPKAGTVGFNQYTCDDGSSPQCGADEWCYANAGFEKSKAGTENGGQGCQKAPTSTPTSAPVLLEAFTNATLPITSTLSQTSAPVPAATEYDAPSNITLVPTTAQSDAASTIEAASAQPTDFASALSSLEALLNKSLASSATDAASLQPSQVMPTQPPQSSSAVAAAMQASLPSKIMCSCSMPKARGVGFNLYSCNDGDTRYCAADEWCHASEPFEKERASVDTGGAGCERKPVLCVCNTPKAGTVGFNQYTCDDGSMPYCGADEWCHSTEPFEKQKAGIDSGSQGCEPFSRDAAPTSSTLMLLETSNTSSKVARSSLLAGASTQRRIQRLHVKGEVVFRPTLKGNGSNNPDDPSKLTRAHRDRSFGVIYKGSNVFEFTLVARGAASGGARNFLFSGWLSTDA
eukprot:TRINITY_DN14021_c0_g1_i2.p1 TRINITY_DN14021_c0_g1~~TRINITY_DN14021_c0_g1_i2.p1  ORF type:complete len:1161 (-),score=139.14 TRINITY_DN14021_c0_g1_i2:2-3484(-)